MDGDVLKGDEYTKVILAPVPCDAHVGILDVLEDRAHIGKQAVAFGLSIHSLNRRMWPMSTVAMHQAPSRLASRKALARRINSLGR